MTIFSTVFLAIIAANAVWFVVAMMLMRSKKFCKWLTKGMMDMYEDDF